MPVPFDPDAPAAPAAWPMAGPVAPPGWNPYQLPDPQVYAVDQERQRHTEALYRFGEYAMFILMWNLRDFEHGLVTRCSLCYAGATARQAAVYQQAKQDDCPTCYGTTFEGGWKAKIVRPSLWDFGEDVDGEGRRGFTISAVAGIQSTSDFQMHKGDLVLRGDGNRWSISSLATHHLRVGFEVPLSTRNSIAFNFGNAVREDESQIAYQITPDADGIREILDVARPRTPVEFASFEEFRPGAVLLDPYETPI